MSAARKVLRADLRDALAAILPGYAPLAGRPVISAWSTDFDASSYPLIGVATPGTTYLDPPAMDTNETIMSAVVVVKRAKPDGTDGTGLEDLLDDDEAALAPALIGALISAQRAVELRSSAINISDTGSPRIGTLTLTFEVTQMVARINP